MANRGQQGNPRKQNVVQRNLFETCTLYTFLRANLREWLPFLNMIMILFRNKVGTVAFVWQSCFLLHILYVVSCKTWEYLQKLTRFASAHISRAWLLRPAAVCIVYKVGQGEVGLVEFKACCASRENNASGRQPCLLPFVQQYFRTNTETSGNYNSSLKILRPVQGRYIWITHIENAEPRPSCQTMLLFCYVIKYTKYKYKYKYIYKYMADNYETRSPAGLNHFPNAIFAFSQHSQQMSQVRKHVESNEEMIWKYE